MDKLPPAFPCTQGDPAFGLLSSLHDAMQLVFGGVSGRCIGEALIELSGTFHPAGFRVLNRTLKQVNVHRHHAGQRRHLPSLGGPNHQGRSPKLGWQLSAKLPAHEPHGESGKPNGPPRPQLSRLRLFPMALRLIRHVLSIQIHRGSMVLSGLDRRAGNAPTEPGKLLGARWSRQGRRGGGS